MGAGKEKLKYVYAFLIFIMGAIIGAVSMNFMDSSQIYSENDQINAGSEISSGSEQLNAVPKVNGIGDSVQLADLSFRLDKVEIVYLNTSLMPIYNPFRNKEVFIVHWNVSVMNTGNNIENVSDCGSMLFEDGTQYSVSSLGGRAFCVSTVLLPGAARTVSSTFFFSPNVYNVQSSEAPTTWSTVPGSKITFFSQQKNGLVKYTINKSEMISSTMLYGSDIPIR